MKNIISKIKLWYYFKYTHPKWDENTTSQEKYRNFLRLKALAENDML